MDCSRPFWIITIFAYGMGEITPLCHNTVCCFLHSDGSIEGQVVWIQESVEVSGNEKVTHFPALWRSNHLMSFEFGYLNQKKMQLASNQKFGGSMLCIKVFQINLYLVFNSKKWSFCLPLLYFQELTTQIVDHLYINPNK